MSKSRNNPKGRSGRKHPQSPKPKWVAIVFLAFLGTVAVAYFVFFSQGTGSEQPNQAVNAGKPIQTGDIPGLGPDANRLIGRWSRPDGGYIIEIRNIDSKGLADAVYFNPRPIHVSKAVAARRDNALEFFMELRDEGYPGSTYTLVYDVQRDLLAGIYYQAAMNQSYDVMFLRSR